MNMCLERVHGQHFRNPGVFIYAMIPSSRPNSRDFFFIVTSVVYDFTSFKSSVISLDYGMEYVIIFSSFHFVTIDYKFKDGHFPMSAICVTISKSESLSSNETKVNTKKLKKKHSSD